MTLKEIKAQFDLIRTAVNGGEIGENIREMAVDGIAMCDKLSDEALPMIDRIIGGSKKIEEDIKNIVEGK